MLNSEKFSKLTNDVIAIAEKYRAELDKSLILLKKCLFWNRTGEVLGWSYMVVFIFHIINAALGDMGFAEFLLSISLLIAAIFLFSTGMEKLHWKRYNKIKNSVIAELKKIPHDPFKMKEWE